MSIFFSQQFLWAVSNFLADISSKIIALADPVLSQPDMEWEIVSPQTGAYIPSFTIYHVLPDLSVDIETVGRSTVGLFEVGLVTVSLGAGCKHSRGVRSRIKYNLSSTVCHSSRMMRRVFWCKMLNRCFNYVERIPRSCVKVVVCWETGVIFPLFFHLPCPLLLLLLVWCHGACAWWC